MQAPGAASRMESRGQVVLVSVEAETQGNAAMQR